MAGAGTAVGAVATGSAPKARLVRKTNTAVVASLENFIFASLVPEMGTIRSMRDRDDAVARVERRHRYAHFARLLQRISERLFVFEPAAAQHVLLGGHAVLGRILAEALA